MKTAVVIAVATLANSFANLCLSIGMKQIGPAQPMGLAWIVGTGFHVVSNGWMILGVLLLLVFLAAYLTALSWADLSFVLPATAPGYLINAGLSKIFLHESLSLSRWAGTVLIVTGTWQNSGQAGDFGLQWPGYRWTVKNEVWSQDTMRLVTIEVTYQVQGQDYSVRLSTLVPNTTP